MKKIILYFLQKPLLITILSLVVAGSVGYYEYQQYNVVPAYQFIKAGPGSIASAVTSDGDSQHVSLSLSVGGRVNSVSVKVGDSVKKGQTLIALDPDSTLGATTQAQAAYASAQANYQKLLNGATSQTINVANSSVATAQQNLDHAISNVYTQVDSIIKTSVDSLYVYPTATEPQFEVAFFDATTGSNITLTPPDINQRLDLGNKRKDIGVLMASWKNSTSVSATSSSPVMSDDAQATLTLNNLATIKTYLNAVSDGLATINYDTKYSAQVEGHKSDISAAKATIDTLINTIQSNQLALQNAKTSVTAVTTTARPEDIELAKAQMNSALGALQIAQAAYNNRTLVAPGDGTVTALHISAGETAVPNTTVVELSGNNFSKTVAVMIPKSTVEHKNGKDYVLVKTLPVVTPTGAPMDATTTRIISSGVEEREVVLGDSDSQNVEVVSGLSADDYVVSR